MKHWIVVADAGSCRIWETNARLADWSLVQSMENERIHLDASELKSGQRGRMITGPGGAHSAYESNTEPHEVERERFAKEIGDTLNLALTQNRWDRLVLAAPPKFLGLLRAELSDGAAKRVAASLHHDLVKTPQAELPDLIRGHLPEIAGPIA